MTSQNQKFPWWFPKTPQYFLFMLVSSQELIPQNTQKKNWPFNSQLPLILVREYRIITEKCSTKGLQEKMDPTTNGCGDESGWCTSAVGRIWIMQQKTKRDNQVLVNPFKNMCPSHTPAMTSLYRIRFCLPIQEPIKVLTEKVLFCN